MSRTLAKLVLNTRLAIVFVGEFNLPSACNAQKNPRTPVVKGTPSKSGKAIEKCWIPTWQAKVEAE